jgi:hypothetical protein
LNYLINVTFHISNFFLFAFLSYWSGYYLNTLLQITEPYNYITGLVGCGFLSYKIYQYFKVHRPVFNDIDYEKDNPEYTVKKKSSWTSWLWPIIFIIGIGLFSLAKSPEIKNIRKFSKEQAKAKLEQKKVAEINWHYIGKNKKLKIYAKPTIFKSAIPVRNIVILLNSFSSFKINEKKSKSKIVTMKIDCITEIYSIVNSKSYSNENGLGTMLFENSKAQERKRIKKGSGIQKIKEYLCKDLKK